jgi:hypothetical protein
MVGFDISLGGMDVDDKIHSMSPQSIDQNISVLFALAFA